MTTAGYKNSIKTAMLLVGAAAAQAQSVNIVHDGAAVTAFHCMDANTSGITFSAAGNNLVEGSAQGVIESYSWSLAGGIEAVGATNGSAITVKAMQGADQDGSYSKYAKGKLHISAHVKYTDSIFFSCNGTSAAQIYTYYKDYGKDVEIRKTFSSQDNSIVGPTCVKPGTKVTYSVAPWVSLYELGTVGLDKYDWDIPSGIGSAIYYSADNSSVTFTAAREAVSGDAIKVGLGSCNIQTGATPLSFPIREDIPDPIIVPNVCIPGGKQTVYFKVNNALDGVTYYFSVDENWYIYDKDNNKLPTYEKIGILKGDSVKVETDINNRATISVEAKYTDNDGCDAKRSSVRMMRSLSSISSISATSTNDCYVAGVPVTFTLNNAPSPALFNWVLPEGWIPVGNANAANITAKPDDYAAVLPIDSIRVSVDVCDAAYISRNVYVTPGAAGEITEANGKSLCIVKDSVYTFQIAPTQPGAASYTWELSNGWTDTVHSADGLSITATATGNNISLVKVTPRGAAHLVGSAQTVCSGTPKQLTTLSYPPTKPSVIGISQTCVNAGTTDTLTFSVSQKAGETYEWTFTDPSGSTSVRTGAAVSFISSGATGTITASVIAKPTATGSVCSSSDARDTTIEVSDKGLSLGYNSVGYYMILNPNNENVSYTGHLLYNGVEVTNGVVNVADVMFYMVHNGILGNIDDSPNYTLIMDAAYAGGCRVRMTTGAPLSPAQNAIIRSLPLASSNSSISQAGATSATKKVDFATIYPNPTKDVINIDIADGASYPVAIYVVDITGTLVAKTTVSSASTQINTSSWAAGNYVVVVGSGQNVQKQVVVKN
ncbi:MAG: T9SS type A sorting domain-containing protein [Prevotellaceae bacterium]|jgi:hypothetical protein|nr:T9SS type A sorting domain-containing protein [Prevotellaceae bacterium]